MKNKTHAAGITALFILALILFVSFSFGNKPQMAVNGSATVGIVSLETPFNSAGVALVGTKNIEWQTAGYPDGVGVDIHLIEKTSDSPLAYSLVREIAHNVPNNGNMTWNPSFGETGNSMYIEVTCTSSHQFDKGCAINAEPLAVN